MDLFLFLQSDLAEHSFVSILSGSADLLHGCLPLLILFADAFFDKMSPLIRIEMLNGSTLRVTTHAIVHRISRFSKHRMHSTNKTTHPKVRPRG